MIWSNGERLLRGSAPALRRAGVQLAIDNPLYEVAQVLGPRAAKAIGLLLADVVASLGTSGLVTWADVGTGGLGTGGAGWFPTWAPGPIGYRPVDPATAIEIWASDGHSVIYRGTIGDLDSKTKKKGWIASYTGERWVKVPDVIPGPPA